jgi:ketosteroid isomerase-like protein
LSRLKVFTVKGDLVAIATTGRDFSLGDRLERGSNLCLPLSRSRVWVFTLPIPWRMVYRTDGYGEQSRRELAMTQVETNESVQVVLEAFHAVEDRDERRLLELYHPEVEFHWPASLPYGGSFRADSRRPGQGWSEVWDPLQPSEAERRMDPRVVAATAEEIVVLWRQRGLSPRGERFDGEVLGLYGVRDGKFARAQMFYFDSAAVLRFLDHARAREPGEGR